MATRYSKDNILEAKRYAMTPLTAAILCALYPTAPVLAQEESTEQLDVEEIIVTATRREMSIQDVPQSITAFSTTEIERRGMLNIADIATNLPSVTMSSIRADQNHLVYRGISTGGGIRHGGGSVRLDSQVAMYLDEIPMTSSLTNFDPRMVDIERVESLPGPQGTLFGSSSQAGTLRIVSNKPRTDSFSGELGGEIKSTHGGDESYDIHGHVNIPVSDNFAVRLVAYDIKEGGWIDNVFSTAPNSACTPGAPCDHDFSQYAIGPLNPVDPQGYLNSVVKDNAGLEEDDFNVYKLTGGRVSALWNVNEDWSALVSIIHQDSLTTGVWYSDAALGDYKVARFADEWRKDEWTVSALTVTGNLGFAEFSGAFGYADRVGSYEMDNMHYDAYHSRVVGNYLSAWKNWYDYMNGNPIYQYNYYDKYDTGYNGGIYRDMEHNDRITAELRLTSTSDSRFQWMIGAFYENNKDGFEDEPDIPNLTTTKFWRYTQWRQCDLASQGFQAKCPPDEPGTNWYQDHYDREISQIATFAQVDYDLTDKLTLSAGLRWFQFDRHTVTDRQWPPGAYLEDVVIAGETFFIEDGTDSDTSYKLGMSWNLSDDKMVYGLVSTGYRLGGANNSRAVEVGFVPALYKPDVLTNYEVGTKSQFLDGRLQINAAAFHMVWDDIQLEVRSGEIWWLRGLDNGGGGENTGVEFDAVWQATDNLTLSGSAYFGDPVYTEDYQSEEKQIRANTAVVHLNAGTPMPRSARRKYTLAADYEIRDVLGGDILLRYDYYHQSGLFSELQKAEWTNPESAIFRPGSTFDVEGFDMSNFQIGYERESWSARLMARNLFNDRANSFTSDEFLEYGVYWGHSGFGESHNLARPRTISLSLTKRFD